MLYQNPLDRETAHLRRYLRMSNEDKARDAARHIPFAFVRWAEIMGFYDPTTSDIDPLDSWEITDDIIDTLPEKALATWIENADVMVNEDPVEAPSYFYLEYLGIVPFQWLVHYTSKNNGLNIQQEGFVYGVDDQTRLALTTMLPSLAKTRPGYDFAYKAAVAWRGDARTKTAIMFQARGIEIYHRGDEENQVIFWGPSAKNLVLLCGGEWHNQWDVYTVDDRSLAEKTGITNAVNWVKTNYDQYRRVLTEPEFRTRP